MNRGYWGLSYDAAPTGGCSSSDRIKFEFDVWAIATAPMPAL
jgi:hypothetical protein